MVHLLLLAYVGSLAAMANPTDSLVLVFGFCLSY